MTEKQRINREKAEYSSEINHLKRLIEDSQKENLYNSVRGTILTTFEYLQQLSDREKYDIIHRHIKSVSITNCTDRKATKKIEIDTFPLDRFDRRRAPIYYYSYRLKDKAKQVFKEVEISERKDKIVEIPYIEIVERFKRKQ